MPRSGTKPCASGLLSFHHLRCLPHIPSWEPVQRLHSHLIPLSAEGTTLHWLLIQLSQSWERIRAHSGGKGRVVSRGCNRLPARVAPGTASGVSFSASPWGFVLCALFDPYPHPSCSSLSGFLPSWCEGRHTPVIFWGCAWLKSFLVLLSTERSFSWGKNWGTEIIQKFGGIIYYLSIFLLRTVTI